LVNEFVALPPQAADDQLAVEHVHLAANGVNEQSFRVGLHERFRGTGYEPGPGVNAAIRYRSKSGLSFRSKAIALDNWVPTQKLVEPHAVLACKLKFLNRNR